MTLQTPLDPNLANFRVTSDLAATIAKVSVWVLDNSQSRLRKRYSQACASNAYDKFGLVDVYSFCQGGSILRTVGKSVDYDSW